MPQTSLEFKGKWISVEEELPEWGTGVLIHQPMTRGLWIITVAQISINGNWTTVDFWNDDPIHELTPTHWMPIPNPPGSKLNVEDKSKAFDIITSKDWFQREAEFYFSLPDSETIEEFRDNLLNSLEKKINERLNLQT